MSEKGFKYEGKATVPSKIIEAAINVFAAKKGITISCGDEPIVTEGRFETSDSLVEFGNFLMGVAREGRKVFKEDQAARESSQIEKLCEEINSLRRENEKLSKEKSLLVKKIDELLAVSSESSSRED